MNAETICACGRQKYRRSAKCQTCAFAERKGALNRPDRPHDAKGRYS